MGDRNNPIKFGPEWLRNMSRERSAARSAQPTQQSGGAGAAAGPSAGPTPSTSSTQSHTNNSSHASKVLLAKLRYGREEMLACYDRTAEAPSELRFIDTLYQPRGKQPLALNNSFEEEMRDNLRSAPPIGGISSRDGFGLGRGSGRGITVEGRGRARGFIRQPTTGRGTSWHAGSSRTAGYSGVLEDDGAPLRSWNTINMLNRSNGGDQLFRNRRPGMGSTNWRQPQVREEADEWRAEPGRSRPHDKWERDYSERPTSDKPQSWSSNRRTWVGADTHNNEENLPEWAVENAECSGTFDSSGAFHGYSNDDTNLPRAQGSSHPLTRSHTQGHFSRPKTVEEGSDEWWASEKAKKLSPKRFEASDKYKKQSSLNMEAGTSQMSSTEYQSMPSTSKEEAQQVPEKLEAQATAPEPPEPNSQQNATNKNVYKSKFSESKTFDAMMRNDINMEEASDERGNFQSVIITPNNSLRQKHQHLVPANKDKAHSSTMPAPKAAAASNIKKHDMELKNPEDLLVDKIFGMTMDEKEGMPTPMSNSRMGIPSPALPMGSSANTLAQNHTSNIQMSMANSVLSMQGHSMDTSQQNVLKNMQSSHQSILQTSMLQQSIQAQGIPINLQVPPPVLPSSGLQTSMASVQNSMQQMGIQSAMQPVGITNSALNASLGLPLVPSGNLGLPLTNVPPPVFPNVCMANNMGAMASSMQPGNIPAYQNCSGMPGNNSLFLGQDSNNPSMSSSSDIPMPNQGGQNMYPMHGLQHSGSQLNFQNSIFSNGAPNLGDQWYYEDPKGNIQGPFSSTDMYNWYRAGFFTPSLMVRRACETTMRPLGSYGLNVPFAQVDMMGAYPMSAGFDSRPQGGRDSMLNSQAALGLDVDLLWGQPANDLLWMQRLNSRNDTRVNNLPMFFWDQQPSAIASNSLLSEDVTKEMKTEDQILAQLRASQNLPQPPSIPFMGDQPPASTPASAKPEEVYRQTVTATPNLEELQRLMQKDALAGHAAAPTPVADSEPTEPQTRVDKSSKSVSPTAESAAKTRPQSKQTAESKSAKQAKVEADKTAKNKENNNTKNKSKKGKDEKKDEIAEVKSKEEDVLKAEKRSQESSPSKTKKEDKSNKKDLEREKKEWIKEGFTIVKGPEKTTVKDTKKKVEEARAAEEAERKRKEEEKLVAEEDKRKKQADALRKQQEQNQQQQRQATESVAKKAPWSGGSGAPLQPPSRELPTLAEIQRLEREKKLEQMKEQQQMMHMIAQQQAAALAREQEMQAGLGWAKKKVASMNTPGQNLADIQAEARRQAAAVAAQAAQMKAIEEAHAIATAAAAAAATTNHAPWANAHNGGGFWDTQPNQPSKPEKSQEPAKAAEPKNKKKLTLTTASKKENSPAVEFEAWCMSFLSPWSSKIDAPTFVGFLKDIESPYEVKDYVKCYLGDSKDSNDFARQFLERRSKLLRVGMVTPSDDLCSPALAVNPRTVSASDYQEVKGKGKKTKKNKMLKIDARILGFSVTASEDRINVGDIDTV